MKTTKQRFFLAINMTLGISEIADNQSAFARKYGLNQSLISRCLRDGQHSTKNWIFKWRKGREILK